MGKELKFKGERLDCVATVKGYNDAPFGCADKYSLDLVTDEMGDILATGWGSRPDWIDKDSVTQKGGLLAKMVIDVVPGLKQTFYNIKQVDPITTLDNSVKAPKQGDTGDIAPTPNTTPPPQRLSGNEASMVLMNARYQAMNVLSRVDSQQKIDLLKRNVDDFSLFVLTGTFPSKKNKGDKKP